MATVGVKGLISEADDAVVDNAKLLVWIALNRKYKRRLVDSEAGRIEQ